MTQNSVPDSQFVNEDFRTEDLRTVPQFCDANPIFTQPAMRWLIFNAKENGLEEAGAIVRIRNRVYLHPRRFSRWAGRKWRVA